MQARLALYALGLLVATSLFACKNADKEKCFQQVEEYDKQKIACLAETDKAKQEACTNRNEVRKMTRKDCDDAYH